MRRLTKLSLLAIPALALVPAGIAAAAIEGDQPAAVGWWSQDPTAAEQPDGGFQVAAAGGQPVSVAAVRFTVPDGATSATLHLQEAEGSVVSPTTALQACPTADQWEPANPGAFDDAPAPDCEVPIALTRDETALTWSASVPAGVAGSLVIVPGETAGGGAPIDPAFQLTFTGAALEVSTGAGAGGFSGPTPPSPTAYKAPGGGASSFSGAGSSSFAAPGPVASSPTTATTAVAETTATTAAPIEGEAIQPFEGGTGGGGVDQPWERLLILVPLSALAGVAFVYGKRILRQRGVLEQA
jgi:hypothetical protein